MRNEEGTTFWVPLRDGGRAAGVMARHAPPLGLGYFFTDVEAIDPSRIRPQVALLVCRFGDGGLVDGSWSPAGPLPGFAREEWPIPAFGQYNELFDVAQRIEFLSDDLTGDTRETRVTREEIEGLPRLGVYGPGAVELALTALAAGGDGPAWMT